MEVQAEIFAEMQVRFRNLQTDIWRHRVDNTIMHQLTDPVINRSNFQIMGSIEIISYTYKEPGWDQIHEWAYNKVVLLDFHVT